MTRWLSLEASVNRVIEQYDVLLIFAEGLSNDEDVVAGKFEDYMRNPTTIQYLYLLRKILGEMNILNKFFQTRGVIIHKVAENIERTYFKNIVSSFLKRQYVISTSAAISSYYLLDEKNYIRFSEFE